MFAGDYTDKEEEIDEVGLAMTLYLDDVAATQTSPGRLGTLSCDMDRCEQL